jgi:ubiquinone/menaquinone biosynthesis C-methylase UbiE
MRNRREEEMKTLQIDIRGRCMPGYRPDEITTNIAGDWKSSPYYAESEQWLPVFWNRETPFRRLFEQLDLDHVIELACGHGRHCTMFVDRARQVTLVDVNEENVQICRERFNAYTHVRCQVNNGCDFYPLSETCCTAIFCYDAMVHFEVSAITSYLSESFRILKPGGRALFHHSNYDANPGGLYG